MNMTSKSARQALLALVVATGAVAATLPESISKLDGSSDDSARAVMAQHGYAERNAKSSWGRKYTYWWSDRTHQCIQLTSMFGRISNVDVKGTSDCVGSSTAGPGGGLIDPAQLVGLPRKAADARLASAGFAALMNDERPEATYVLWFNGRQCLGGNVVGDRYEMLEAMPLNKCKP